MKYDSFDGRTLYFEMRVRLSYDRVDWKTGVARLVVYGDSVSANWSNAEDDFSCVSFTAEQLGKFTETTGRKFRARDGEEMMPDYLYIQDGAP